MNDIWLPEIDGFEAFGRADTGGGYDWSEFGVWLKDGVFYWATDYGCSCSGPWDGFWDGEPGFEFQGFGSAHDAVRALNTWSSGVYSVGSSQALLTKLLDYRPLSRNQGVQVGNGNIQVNSL